MNKLTGGLEYCKHIGCENTVHHEDSPKDYPFCTKHRKMNAPYWKYVDEHKKLLALADELYHA